MEEWQRDPSGERRRYEEYEGEIFYDPQRNCFLQLRGRHDDYLVFSGFCDYFDGAKTTKRFQHLSYEYLRGLKKIVSIDQLEGAEFDGVGWRVQTEIAWDPKLGKSRRMMKQEASAILSDRINRFCNRVALLVWASFMGAILLLLLNLLGIISLSSKLLALGYTACVLILLWLFMDWLSG